jgi:DNA processing protein
MNDELLKLQIAITLIPGVGDVKAKNLISYCGGVEEVFRQKRSQLMKIPDIGPVIAGSITKGNVFRRAEEEIEFIRKYRIKPLFYLSSDYPERLKHCPDSPVMLYYKGNAELNVQRILAIVGTRNATAYGKSVCASLISELKDRNILVVSGLAYGIDIMAHKEALVQGFKTLGVVGHGLDTIYPSVHKQVAEKMVANGGIITEFLSGTKPNAENFPARNRIVAGMSDAVVIVEAALKGGALITAHLANSYNRDVFAVPGRTHDTYSQGCNDLIKTNRAALVESASDIEYIMGWDEKTSGKAAVQKQLFMNLTGEEEKLVNVFREIPAPGIDTLALKAGMPVSKVTAILLELEFRGIVRSLPGKVYQLA